MTRFFYTITSTEPRVSDIHATQRIVNSYEFTVPVTICEETKTISITATDSPHNFEATDPKQETSNRPQDWDTQCFFNEIAAYLTEPFEIQIMETSTEARPELTTWTIHPDGTIEHDPTP